MMNEHKDEKNGSLKYNIEIDIINNKTTESCKKLPTTLDSHHRE